MRIAIDPVAQHVPVVHAHLAHAQCAFEAAADYGELALRSRTHNRVGSLAE